MRSVKLFLTIVILFFLGSAEGQEKYRLQYRYAAGKTYTYREESNFESLQEINGQEMKASGSTFSLTKVNVDNITENGNITLINSLEDLQVSTKMATMDTTMVMKDFLDKKVRTVITSSGKLIEQTQIDTINASKGLFGRGNTLMSLYREFIIFPDSAVKTGDSWTDERNDTVEGTLMVTNTKMTYTLLGTEEKNGHQCLKFGLKGKVETGGKMTQMGMEFFIDGSGEVSGNAWIDKESGILISKESITDQEMTMALTGQMQMTIPITQTVSMKFMLVE